MLRARLKADIPVKELESLTDASSISKQVETILDQIKHLRAAVSTTIDKAKNKPPRKAVECRIFSNKLDYFDFLFLDEFLIKFKAIIVHQILARGVEEGENIYLMMYQPI